MPTTTVHLVRHADPEPGGDDPGLSTLGRKQATAVGAGLRSVGVSEVLHGSRTRASQTAKIVADLLGVPCKASVYGNDLTPVPHDWSTVPSEYHEFLRSVPASEQDPGGAALDAAFSELGTVGSDDRTVAVVTHGFVIGWFVRRALDAPWWRWIGLNQEYATITTVQWSSDLETRLLRFNEQPNQRT